jgi:hypothetical protein
MSLIENLKFDNFIYVNGYDANNNEIFGKKSIQSMLFNLEEQMKKSIQYLKGLVWYCFVFFNF